MLLYSRKKVRYRRDGYCWKKRKDGKTTREDHMKLKVQGTEVSSTLRNPLFILYKKDIWTLNWTHKTSQYWTRSMLQSKQEYRFILSLNWTPIRPNYIPRMNNEIDGERGLWWNHKSVRYCSLVHYFLPSQDERMYHSLDITPCLHYRSNDEQKKICLRNINWNEIINRSSSVNVFAYSWLISQSVAATLHSPSTRYLFSVFNRLTMPNLYLRNSVNNKISHFLPSLPIFLTSVDPTHSPSSSHSVPADAKWVEDISIQRQNKHMFYLIILIVARKKRLTSRGNQTTIGFISITIGSNDGRLEWETNNSIPLKIPHSDCVSVSQLDDKCWDWSRTAFGRQDKNCHIGERRWNRSVTCTHRMWSNNKQFCYVLDLD